VTASLVVTLWLVAIASHAFQWFILYHHQRALEAVLEAHSVLLRDRERRSS
jgi:formate-dependent nitrite reductase membrane component NrfD